MATLFSRIVSGEIQAHKIAENDEFLAFLDINPLVMGHTLVIPKQEIDYILNLDDELLSRLMIFAKEVGLAVEKSVECKRIGIAVIGLEVPHCHIHLVPLKEMDDINFTRPKLQPEQKDLKEMAEKIRSHM
ncbi:MAG: HIT family protein [Bacteroidales bacterium]|jgi:histidine triad (HIT) family protein|nr:HIT family protein [Bacteroidales bacterium]